MEQVDADSLGVENSHATLPQINEPSVYLNTAPAIMCPLRSRNDVGKAHAITGCYHSHWPIPSINTNTTF